MTEQWTAEAVTQLADYAAAGPQSPMVDDLIAVARLYAAALRRRDAVAAAALAEDALVALAAQSSAPVTPEHICSCGTTMVCPDIGCDRNKPVTPEPPRPRHHFACPECQIAVAVDEDGCCRGCGHDTTPTFAPLNLSPEPPPEVEQATNRCMITNLSCECPRFTCKHDGQPNVRPV